MKFKVVLDVSFLRINARMQKYGKFVGKAKKVTVKCVVGVAGSREQGMAALGRLQDEGVDVSKMRARTAFSRRLRAVHVCPIR